jgi:hypothetical protein
MNRVLNFLTKFKDPRTNWKYILIVVVLATIGAGAILEYQSKMKEEIVPFYQVPQIGKTKPKVKTSQPKLEEGQELIGEYGGRSYKEVLYKNEKFGFEFRYPKTYAEDKCAQVKEGENFITIGACIELVISESDTSNLVEYVKKEISERELNVESQENVVISGEKAIKIKFYYSRGYGESVFLMKNGKIYYFNRVDEGECPVAFQNGPSEWTVFDRILESFRFLR